nr:IS200/IS605 family transposase [Methanobrevibacter sp.]
MGSILNRNQHSVYILTYHLVLVIKYRRKVINEDIFDSLMVIFDNIGFKYGIVVKEVNWEVDYIHILFEAKPSTNLVKFINSYKSASSRIIKKQYPVLKKSFMEKCFLENRLFYYNNWWSEY